MADECNLAQDVVAIPGTDIVTKLGDNAGVNKFTLTDTDDASVFSIDSNGNVNVENALNIHDPGSAEFGSITRDGSTLNIDSGTGAVTLKLFTAGTEQIRMGGTSISIWARVYPISDSVLNFGDTTHYWNDGYIDDIYTEGLHIQDPTHVESASITRSLTDLEIYGGTGCTYVKIGLTEYEILLSNNAIQFAGDHYATTDSLWENGLITRWWKKFWSDENNMEIINIWDPTHVEYGSIVRDLNDLHINAGTGALAINLDIAGTDRIEITAAVTKFRTDVQPMLDNTYYLGRNDDDSPLAWKGVILKDTTDGKYYRIEVTNGAVAVIDLTD